MIVLSDILGRKYLSYECETEDEQANFVYIGIYIPVHNDETSNNLYVYVMHEGRIF